MYNVTIKKRGVMVALYTEVEGANALAAINSVEEAMGVKPARVSYDQDGKQVVTGWSGFCFEAERIA